MNIGNKPVNVAFYLKYRPASLDDLIGQDNVKKILFQAFQNKKLSHAYLFVGPRGTGKTSTARILAKMVNCQEKDAPCNKCPVCISVSDGSNLDLIEIDAASNRGIEDIRSLRERVKLSPTGAGKKVYIIDEVHMLTTEAFNALLKTLEEPPAHALFILATTEVAKVPLTIMSRVQRLNFNLATAAQLKEALEKIVVSEKIDIDAGSLEIIIKRADGSFRDAIKLLDQFSSFGEKITEQDLLNTLKTPKFDDLIDLLESLNNHKATESLLAISNYLKNGADVKELISSLMEMLRDLMFVKNGLGLQLVGPKVPEDKYNLLTGLANQFSAKGLSYQLNILQEALSKLKVVPIPSLPLELAVVEICEENSKFSAKDDGPLAQKAEEINMKDQTIDAASSTLKKPSPAIYHPSSSSESSDDILKIKEKWNFVLETIRPYNFSLEALLRSVNIAECNEKVVIIEVPYAFHQRILEAPKNRDTLESVISDVLGRQVRITTVLGDRPRQKEDIANIEVAADDEIIRVAAEIFNSDPVN